MSTPEAPCGCEEAIALRAEVADLVRRYHELNAFSDEQAEEHERLRAQVERLHACLRAETEAHVEERTRLRDALADAIETADSARSR